MTFGRWFFGTLVSLALTGPPGRAQNPPSTLTLTPLEPWVIPRLNESNSTPTVTTALESVTFTLGSTSLFEPVEETRLDVVRAAGAVGHTTRKIAQK